MYAHRRPISLRSRRCLVQEDPRALVAAVVLVEAQHSGDGLVVDLIVDVEVDFSELTCSELLLINFPLTINFPPHTRRLTAGQLLRE